MKKIAEITNKYWPNPAKIMKGWVFLFVFFACLHGSPEKVYAQTTNQIYIAQSVLGQGNGADCADAYPVAWFNDPSNWSATPATGKIGPGATVHLCGTISGTVNQNILTFNGSGTANNPITLHWEPQAVLTTPACPGGWDTGCIYTGLNSNLVIDGNGTNPSIVATDNGSAAGGYGNQIGSTGIYARACNNCELKNLTISNMYMMTDPNDSNAESTDVVISESSNTSIHDSVFDQTEQAISDSFANGDTNLSFYNNTIDHFNHGIVIGQNNSNVISNVRIYGNHLKNMVTWDSTGDWYHHDGIFFFQDSVQANSIQNFYIYNNLADGDMGNNATAWVYYNSGLNGIYVYNNVLLNTASRSAFMLEGGFSGDQNFFILNNYMDCGGSSGVNYGGVTNVTFENNTLNNCWTYIYFHNVTVGNGAIDYNVYADVLASSTNTFIWNGGQNFGVYKQETGFDAHSLTPSTTGADAEGNPLVGSAMIGAGANLSALNISGLNVDNNGNARPATGAWDNGAYEYEGSLGSIYIAQTASGAANGSSCINPQSVAFLNNASNWGIGAGQIAPGMTVHLCGIISTAINVLGSGTAGHPITIYFEPGAKMSAPVFSVPSWAGGGAITIDAQNYITIDGGADGVIENTANGTGLANSAGSTGIGAISSSYFTVKNLTIRNIYVRSSTADESAGGVGIENWNTEPPYTFTNFLATNNTISDTATGIWSDYGTNVSGIEWSSNTIFNVNWGMAMGDRGAGATASNINIHNNHVYSFSNWDDPANDNYHHNGWYGWAESGGTLTNVNIYNNTFGPGFGNQYQTSAIFDSGQVGNINVYNNLFLSTDGSCPADAMITIGEDNVSSIDHIYNNTFIGTGNCRGIGVGGDANSQFIVENNIASGLASFISFGTDGASFTSDYNLGYNLNASEAYDIVPQNSGGTSSFQTLAQWRALGYDLHSLSSNPNLSSTYTLQAGSPAIGAGVNMTSLGITTLDFDAAGTTRPSSGAWDMGAYEYTGPSSGNINYGDVNGDGQVTIYDAELTAQYSVGLPVANFNTTAAKVDGNSTVDIYDAYLIAEYAVGVITKFPVQ